MLDAFASYESNVRGYIRLFPTVFDRAIGSEIWDTQGQRYIDFFCGAGSLNYGHNNRRAKAALIEYLQRDGIQHSLDAATAAKERFLEAFQSTILKPRGMDYRLQFTGPTGTNAVEAAIKLARKTTKRSHIVAFTHAYHGHSLGSLSLTANSYYHDEHYGSRNNVTHLPFDGYLDQLDSASLLAKMLNDSSSGLPKPAAIILETIQGEGGINVAANTWLQAVERACREHGCLLIVDDIQVGNGRTGDFFSFEESGIRPDIVCLSKSIGGGLPMSLVLIASQHDNWLPGEHTGTFRGNNLAFVAATELLSYWRDESLRRQIQANSLVVAECLDRIVASNSSGRFVRRGRGLIQGLDTGCGELARRIIDACFANGLLLEASGADDEVLKLMPALTIDQELLREGLAILESAVASQQDNAARSTKVAINFGILPAVLQGSSESSTLPIGVNP